MDFHYSKENGKGKHGVNNNQHGKWKQLQESDTEQDENCCQKGDTQKFTEWQSPNDYEDGNADIFNLQRLAMEHQRSPFPDFQFEILDEEADTDDNKGEYNLATGTRKKQPTRMDSWEDNWLFQQRKCNSRTATDRHNTLMSMKMHGTIEEHNDQGTEDNEKDESDVSECSGDCKSSEVQRVERPCVRTSSSSSDAEDSEDSESPGSPSRKSPSIESDDKVPFFESIPSTSEHSGNPLLPKFLIERSYSPHPVSGTKSCTSEDSSSDEFEKKAAAYKSRRRASWCPLETNATAKKRGKRRQALLPLRVDEDEPELEVKPITAGEEALVGLERQMLHRDTYHSSFRAKKASPNFVLNPLYVPEGEGAHRHDPFNEPNGMQHLQPSKSESGYSSCSPDSTFKQNNMLIPPHDRKFHLGVGHEASNPTQQRMQFDPRGAPADPDSSFLW